MVAILDRRVLTKSYGRSFLDSLPQCTLRAQAALESIRALAEQKGLDQLSQDEINAEIQAARNS